MDVDVNRKEWVLELSESNLAEKIIIDVCSTVSKYLKHKDNLVWKNLLQKYESGLSRKGYWCYRVEVGMLNYFQVSTQPEIPTAVHQSTYFSNNLLLMH